MHVKTLPDHFFNTFHSVTQVFLNEVLDKKSIRETILVFVKHTFPNNCYDSTFLIFNR